MTDYLKKWGLNIIEEGSIEDSIMLKMAKKIFLKIIKSDASKIEKISVIAVSCYQIYQNPNIEDKLIDMLTDIAYFNYYSEDDYSIIDTEETYEQVKKLILSYD